MNCVRILVDFVGIMLELYFTTILFGSLWKKKEGVPGAVFYVGFVAVVSATTYIPALKSYNVIILVAAICGLSFVYEEKWLSRLFYSVFITIGLVLSEIVVGLIMIFILGGSVEERIDNLLFYTCGVIFSKFIMYSIIRLVVLQKGRRSYTGFLAKIPQMIVLSIVTVYVTTVIFFLSYESNSEFVILLTILTVLLLIAANVLILTISDKILEQEMKLQSLEFAEERLKQQEEYYKTVVDKQKEILRIRHDMNNYLLSLAGYIEENQTEKALEKISQKTIKLRKEEYILCENPCIAALLSAKCHIMQKKNVKFDYRIQMPEKLLVDETELCIILGNLLDNAIEACEKFENREGKTIFLKIRYEEDYIVMNITNPVCKGFEPEEGRKTLKKQKGLHGFGMENVRILAEKYDGTVMFSCEDNIFSADVLLKNDV